MKNLQKDIVLTVIPDFTGEPVYSIVWGEWKSAGPEEEIVEVKINGKCHLLLESYGGVPSGDPAKWGQDFWAIEDIKNAGYDLSKAVKAKQPITLELWESEFVVRMEHTKPALIDYVLFAK
ncbi:MAG: hypothetical protein ABI716_02120 [Candidatus Saccharibacteria bacterium]